VGVANYVLTVSEEGISERNREIPRWSYSWNEIESIGRYKWAGRSDTVALNLKGDKQVMIRETYKQYAELCELIKRSFERHQHPEPISTTNKAQDSNPESD